MLTQVGGLGLDSYWTVEETLIQLMTQTQFRRAMVEFCCQRYFMALVLPWITSGCNQDKLSSDFTLFLNFGYPASFAFQPVGMLV